MHLINILFLISVSCNQNTMDISEFNLDEEATSIIEKLPVKNSYAIDKEEKIWNYFIDEDNSDITYKTVSFDTGIELGVYNNILSGIKGVTNQTEKSDQLLKHLQEKYGKGKLVNQVKDNKTHIWESNDLIIHYVTGRVVFKQDNGREETSGTLTLVKKGALENGLWPYSKGLLQVVNLPDIRKD